MEEKAIRFALRYVDANDYEQVMLKQQVEDLLKNFEFKN